jgi:predicted lipid-binding transport protein (Tim44 family)
MKSKLTLLVTLFSAFFLMFAVVSEADAKRLGGGGLGKVFKTSPFATKKATPAKKDQQQNPAAQKKSGMMGGLMGGLLAGGLFAALLSNGAFEDIQVMDMIIIALLTFLAIRLFKAFMSSRQQEQPQMAADGNPQRHRFKMPHDRDADHSSPVQETPVAQSTSFNQDEVPFNLPPGFDQQGFIEGSLNHYCIVQESWNKGELDVIEEYVSPELFTALSQQHHKLMAPPQTKVVNLSAEIVRADQAGDSAEISILFRGMCKDELENSQKDIYDIWHLQRDLNTENADWVIVGIEA